MGSTTPLPQPHSMIDRRNTENIKTLIFHSEHIVLRAEPPLWLKFLDKKCIYFLYYRRQLGSNNTISQLNDLDHHQLPNHPLDHHKVPKALSRMIPPNTFVLVQKQCHRATAKPRSRCALMIRHIQTKIGHDQTHPDDNLL